MPLHVYAVRCVDFVQQVIEVLLTSVEDEYFVAYDIDTAICTYRGTYSEGTPSIINNSIDFFCGQRVLDEL
jgi:hypothetical protein